MLDLWLDLPAWLRAIVALVLMGAGAAIVYGWLDGDWRVAQFTFLPPLGCAMGAMGFAMLCVGGRSRAERNGYRSI